MSPRRRSAHVVLVAWSAGEVPPSVPGDVEVVIPPRETGLAASLNDAVGANPGADLVVVTEPCRLPDDWIEPLRTAAYDDELVAGAVPLLAGPSPQFDDFALSPASAPLEQPLHPRIFLLRPPCAYIRASTLELLGPFAGWLADPAALLEEYSGRCSSRGLGIALADGVLVERVAADQAAGAVAEEVARLYPWLSAAKAEEDALAPGPLRRALVAVRADASQISVTVDARSLGSRSSGTETYTLGLTLGLASSGFRVCAVVRDDFDETGFAELHEREVAVVRESEARRTTVRSDIAHRPQQAFVPEDLALLRQVGERVVLSHLDLIAYRSPGYHASADEWRRYRRLTRIALGAADRVVFLSEHARRDAVAEELIEERWTSVVGSGIVMSDARGPARRPDAVPENRPFVLVLGADYFHKNRLFALDLVEQLRVGHGWGGLLVLAGSHVPNGGSAALEAEVLRDNAELARRTLDLGAVTAEERNWLQANARAVLFPSVYEGFGLVPLEAAAAGVPCVFAATTSLAEVAGTEAASIVPWDVTASAARVLPLLEGGEERRRHLALLRAAANRFKWTAVIEQLAAVYREALASPYRSSVPRAWEELTREQLVVDLDRARRERDVQYEELRAAHEAAWERIRHGVALIEPGGFLTRQQQRGLMRIASRRWLRRPLLAPVGWLGSLGAKKDAEPPDQR